MDLDIDRATRAVGQYFAVSQQEIGDWANGEIVLEGKFKDGLSKIIDGTVQCLNASAWAK